MELDHDHILPFYGVSIDAFHPYPTLVSPWMENGDIMNYIKEHPEVERLQLVSHLISTSRPKILPFSWRVQLIQIASGLSYLHQQDFVHGDIKPVRGFISHYPKSLDSIEL